MPSVDAGPDHSPAAECLRHPGLRALVACGTYRQATEQARRFRDDTTATWYPAAGTFRFPNGSSIEFRAVTGIADVYRLMSVDYQLIVADGVADEFQVHLSIRLRSPGPDIPVLGWRKL